MTKFKNIFIVIFSIFIFTSCVDVHRYGNEGYVEEVKLVDAVCNDGHTYKYKVCVHHKGWPDGYYYLYTNTNYKVGDTIRIK